MVAIPGRGVGLYDLSFLYTRRCDLECPFCMYDSSPRVDDALDLPQLERFLRTVDFELVHACGFYGGEPAVALDGFGSIAMLLPDDVPRFVITNGTWSRDEARTIRFLSWVLRHKMAVFVSGTPYHRRHQDRAKLEQIAASYFGVTLKESDEELLPMGKLSGGYVDCSLKCFWAVGPLRLAVMPDGTIIYQTCDGVYPAVGTIQDSFYQVHRRVGKLREEGFRSVCPHWERSYDKLRGVKSE